MHPALVQAMARGLAASRDGTGPARQLMQAVADVTGIPGFRLAGVQDSIARSGSLRPLQRLLQDPAVSTAENLKWRIKVRHRHSARRSADERLSVNLAIDLTSSRGRLEARLSVLMHRSAAAALAPVATFTLAFETAVAGRHRAFRQSETLSLAPPPAPPALPRVA